MFPVARMVPLFPAILALLSLCLNLNPAMLHLLIQPAENTQVKKKKNYFKTGKYKNQKWWEEVLGNIAAGEEDGR